jgi:sugar diacid utilization regulator
MKKEELVAMVKELVVEQSASLEIVKEMKAKVEALKADLETAKTNLRDAIRADADLALKLTRARIKAALRGIELGE